MNWYWRWVIASVSPIGRGCAKLIVGVIGGTILLFGLAADRSARPAVVVVPLGLAILATEFAWARRTDSNAGAIFGAKPRRHAGDKEAGIVRR